MENKSKLKIIKDLLSITGLSEDEKIEAIEKILKPDRETYNILPHKQNEGDFLVKCRSFDHEYLSKGGRGIAKLDTSSSKG